MDISYYADLAEIIGTIAVVVTLIYVGIQIRQSNRHLEEEAQRARAQSFRENMKFFANNAEAMAKDSGGEKLTASEAIAILSSPISYSSWKRMLLNRKCCRSAFGRGCVKTPLQI